MPRQDRLDFKGAIHLVHVRGSDGNNIFFDPAILECGAAGAKAPNARRFERLMALGSDACLVTVHGYCIEPNLGTLIVQTNGAPLEAFMRRLCGQYARYLRLNRSLASETETFASRYESKVIAPDYLAHALRRAHRAPLVSGWCKSRMDYPFSTERAYMGEKSAVPLAFADVRDVLRQQGHGGMIGYRVFMDRAETPHVTRLFDHGSPLDSRIVGTSLYVQEVRELTSHPPVPPTREQLIRGVTHLLKQPESEIYASSHTGVLCRALVAWYALRFGSATLSGVANWFGVTGAALGQSIRHYRRVAAHLFNLRRLPLEERQREPGTAGAKTGGKDSA